MLSIKRFFTGILFTSCCLLVAESFVIKKKKKKTPSVAILKTQCCDEFGDLLKLFSKILKEMAEIQSLGLEKTYELLEDDKQGFFAHAAKEELSSCLDTMSRFKDQMIVMHEQLQQHKTFLLNLEKRTNASCRAGL